MHHISYEGSEKNYPEDVSLPRIPESLLGQQLAPAPKNKHYHGSMTNELIHLINQLLIPMTTHAVTTHRL